MATAHARHASPLERLLLSESFDGEALVKEPMARHTSYRIGGPADLFVRADSLSAARQVMEACAEAGAPCMAVGRGTNLLVSDEGFSGVILTLGRDFKRMSTDLATGRITAGGAVLLSAVVQEAMRQELSGLEFAVGTPGTIGGALRMNAGTREVGIGSRVASVTVLGPDGALTRRLGDEVSWGYRRSSFSPDEAIVECELALEPGDALAIQRTMESALARRKRTQPLGQPSCGSVFRNPEGASVGALVEELGLKGARHGGAQVSEVHGNFIVNAGGAAARDVRALIDLVQTKVLEAYGIELATEVRFLGFEA